MEEILAILLIFGTPLYVLKRWFDLRQRRLEHGEEGKGKLKELESMREERKLLVQRIENLESIVCDVDYELNMQIRRLVESTSQPLQLPAASEPAPSPRPAVPAPASAAPALAPGSAAPAAPRAPAKRLSAESTALDVRRASAKAPAGRDELELGAVIENRYRIQRLLGRGGMGAVYLADDEVLGEQVALKVISWAGGDQGDLVDRFRREAAVARKVSSPNVIRIHDLGQTRAGLLYISMEYFPGRTLSQMLGSRGTLDETDTRDIVGQICDGLAAAHQAGVIHRDLKPQNVLVGERKAVKLIDFGLAKISVLHGMTATGLIMGTPQYMSPEQVKGLAVDARSDIYSLGAMTYHVVTGRPPFDGATPIAIGFAHLTEAPVAPRTLRPKLSASLDQAILAALSKDPASRQQTVEEFRKAL